jgi:hypothetical protein
LGGMVDGGADAVFGDDRAVAFFAGLLLLFVATSILGLSALLQRRLLRRYSR